MDEKFGLCLDSDWRVLYQEVQCRFLLNTSNDSVFWMMQRCSPCIDSARAKLCNMHFKWVLYRYASMNFPGSECLAAPEL